MTICWYVVGQCVDKLAITNCSCVYLPVHSTHLWTCVYVRVLYMHALNELRIYGSRSFYFVTFLCYLLFYASPLDLVWYQMGDVPTTLGGANLLY